MECTVCGVLSGACATGPPSVFLFCSYFVCCRYRCRLLSDEGLRVLRLPSLVSLDVSSCVALSADAVVAAVRHSPHLRVLHMRGVDVSDAAISAIAAACPRLESLSFGSNNPFGGGRGGAFTAAAIDAVVSCCHDLEQLTAVGSGSGLVDDQLAAALRAHPLPHLTSVDFSGNTRVGDAVVTALVDVCPRLQSVKLFRCTAVADAGVMALMYLPSLTVVDIGNCTSITTSGLMDAVQRLPASLSRLRCGGLRALRESDVVRTLRQHMPVHVSLELN